MRNGSRGLPQVGAGGGPSTWEQGAEACWAVGQDNGGRPRTAHGKACRPHPRSWSCVFEKWQGPQGLKPKEKAIKWPNVRQGHARSFNLKSPEKLLKDFKRVSEKIRLRF